MSFATSFAHFPARYLRPSSRPLRFPRRASTFGCSAAVFALALVVALPVSAQQTAEGTAPADSSAVLPDVVVRAQMDAATEPYAGGQVARGAQAGFLGNLDYMDSPFITTAFTEETLRNRQITEVRDAIRLDSSTDFSLPRSYMGGSVEVRGFPTGDIRINGLRGLTDFDLQADAYERVEIIKGPTALLDGSFGGLGGTINVVTKRAPDAPFLRLDGRYVSDGIYGGHVDLSRRFGENKEFGLRTNLAYSAGDAVIADSYEQNILASTGLDYRGEKLRASADVIFQRNFRRGFQQFASAGEQGSPSGLDNGGALVEDPRDVREGVESTFTALANRIHQTEDLIALGRAEYDLFDDTTISVGYGQAWYNYRSNWPQFRGIDPATGRENYVESKGPYSQRQSSGEALLRQKFSTGAIQHTASLSYNDVRNTSYFSGEEGDAFTLPANSRGRGGPELDLPGGRGKLGSRQDQYSVGLADNLSVLDDRLRLIVGGRHQEVESKSYDQGTFIEGSHTDDEAWTGALGVVGKPLRWLTIYGNYIQGLEPGSVVPRDAGFSVGGQLVTYDNAGQVFDPTVTEQYEGGLKVDFGRIGASAAFYRIARPFVAEVETGPATRRQEQNGEQTNRGIDLAIFGEPAEGVRLTGGVSFIDAELQGTTNGAFDGHQADGIPKRSAVLTGEWDVPFLKGLTLLGGITAKSRQYTTPVNDQEVRSYVVGDLGARYTWAAKYPVTLDLLVTNIADKQYWATVSDATLGYGEPRMVHLQISTTF